MNLWAISKVSPVWNKVEASHSLSSIPPQAANASRQRQNVQRVVWNGGYWERYDFKLACCYFWPVCYRRNFFVNVEPSVKMFFPVFLFHGNSGDVKLSNALCILSGYNCSTVVLREERIKNNPIFTTTYQRPALDFIIRLRGSTLYLPMSYRFFKTSHSRCTCIWTLWTVCVCVIWFKCFRTKESKALILQNMIETLS